MMGSYWIAMTGVLLRRRNKTPTERRPAHEDRGRDWRDAAIAQDTKHYQQKRQGRVLP